jgi:hypothetical protein
LSTVITITWLGDPECMDIVGYLIL